MSAQFDKSFSKYLFSKAKITRFEKTSVEVTVTEILKIKLQYREIQIPIKKQNFEFFLHNFRLTPVLKQMDTTFDQIKDVMCSSLSCKKSCL